MHRSLMAGALVGCIACAAPAQNGDAKLARLGRELDSLRRALVIPGMSAAVVRDGRVVWSRGFGFSDVEHRVPATPETPYQIASLTKTFAAVLLLQLVEQGTVALDDPMSKYDPEDYASDSVRVWHVLTHTSEGVPGTRYAYNGNLFDNLTGVVMKATGERYRVTLANRILDSVGMPSTVPGNDLADNVPAMSQLLGAEREARYVRVLGRLAKSYALYGDSELVATQDPRRGIGAANGIVSTVTDLAAYAAALGAGRLLPPRARALMWTPARANDGRPLPYGLGWFVQPYRRDTLVWHYGYLPDLYSALIVTAPARKLTFIALANSDALSAPFPLGTGDVTRSAFACAVLRAMVFADDPCDAPAREAVTRWREERRASARRVHAVDAGLYDAYVGRYELEPGAAITIVRDGRRLLRRGEVVTTELFPESPTEFFTKAPQAQYVFVKDDAGRVTGLRIRRDGAERLLRKVQ